MTMTKEERLILAVESLRSARASKKDTKGSEYWKQQCRSRKAYVKDLEQMYKTTYYQIIKTFAL